MRKYLLIAFGAMLVLLLALVAVGACAETCSSLHYECGTWDIGGTSVNCGSCGSHESCESGICMGNCQSHDDRKCYNGDVYWYDSCGHREGRYEYCDQDCVDGRCVDNGNNYDHSYYYDGNYYYDHYPQCDRFCNYQSICSQTAYDGCGGICNRITEGVACAGGGLCQNGVCSAPKPVETPAEQVTVVGLTPYATYTSPPLVYHNEQNEFGAISIFILGLACLVLFVALIWALVWIARRI